MKKLFTLLFFIVSVFFSIAQAQSDDLKVTGQVRLRSEFDGRDFLNKTYPATYTYLRSRIGIEKKLGDAEFFLQFQDSRYIGEEGDTKTALNKTDLHQGYMILRQPFSLPLTLKAGRFEIMYGTERFFAKNNWNNIGQAFDGFMASFDFGTKLDVFASSIKNSENKQNVPRSSTDAIPDNSYLLYGVYTKTNLAADNNLDIFAYYETNNTKTDTTNNDIQRVTAGFSHWGKYSEFRTITEAAIQTGSLGAKDLFAYVVALRGWYDLDNISIGIGGELYSGTDVTETEKTNTYNNTFASGHNFNGYMDYFGNIARNTGGLGLNDFYVNVLWKIPASGISVALDVHHMTSNKSSSSDLNALGQEIDVTLEYSIFKSTVLIWGGSVFLPGDLMKEFYAPREDMGFWSYLILQTTI